ncbi:hypothetical protein D6850_10175 [Roseovarius spongiae]|uniref:Uncharacterized protein n=1 Tax=Roseovarius spongiae TaxID=2320272 RepID=A0A3A8AU61_9RHOB|nr:hypothetical protein [Roseovarius spongiae]RKF15194.1 hypothetical protein D6850_10175 [Roseovarius spongiae]
MKTIMMGAIVALAAAATPALAWKGQAVACYDKVWVPATYSTSKHLEFPAKTKWVHRNGQMVQMHYPAVYKETRHVKTPGHYLLRKAACR